MNIAGLSRTKVRRIFLTHWHGDHVAGMLGLIQTIGNSNYTDTLNIYGPKGTKERMFHMMNATVFENKIDIQVHELTPKKGEEHIFLDTEKYKVSCAPLDHTTPCIGYAWYEKEKTRVDMNACKKLGLKEGPLIGKLTRGEAVTVDGTLVKPEDVIYRTAGKKLTVFGDTQPCAEMVMLAEHADVVICEATYCDEHEDKAMEFKHMTATQAAQIASRAEASRLIITHFSQRYTSVQAHIDEAKTVFPKSDAAFDLMRVTF
jgi:ribonuclease Z